MTVKSIAVLASVVFLVGFAFLPAFAQDPQIKMASWAPHTAYKMDKLTTFSIQLYDAKYNPTGNPSDRGSYLNDVDVAIVILNENYDVEFVFQGKTKDNGTYEPGLIIPWHVKNGKHYVETMAWNNDSFEYTSHIMFVDDVPKYDVKREE